MNEQLRELLKKYPDAKIYPFTCYDVVCDDFGYWMGKIKEVYYGKFWINDEDLFFDEKEAIECQRDTHWQNEEYEGIIIKIENK